MTLALVPLFSLLSLAPPATSASTSSVEGPTVAAADLLARSAKDMERVRRALREVLARVQDARDEKDLVKLLCADEKLARLKVLVAVAEKADVALAEAVSGRDAGAPVEASKIAIARGKADGLRTEAAGCIGQLAYEVGGRTTVVIDVAEAPDAGAVTPADALTAVEPYRTEFGIPSDARR